MSEPAGVRLTFRDGGWVLLVAGVLSIALVLWAFAGVLSGHAPKGGFDVSSYGFDLSTCLIPREELMPSGQPRDFLQPLTVEGTMPAKAMAAFNEKHRKRYVVSDDRVIGLVIGGQARAYPLYLLNGHEVIEDTLGGTPIAVTYSPLCDGVVVYDRRVGDRTVHLRLSGILHNTNSLLYDAGDAPSLWRQLDGRAVAGPAAARGEALTPIRGIALTTWADWTAAHPDTDVPERIEGNIGLYESISYRREHAAPTLPFPVTPMPSEELPLKAPILLVEVGAAKAALAVDRMRHAATDGLFTIELGGETIRVHLPASEGSAWRVEAASGAPVLARGAFWFAAWSILGERSPLPAK